jgi:hypothetical protein
LPEGNERIKDDETEAGTVKGKDRNEAKERRGGETNGRRE